MLIEEIGMEQFKVVSSSHPETPDEPAAGSCFSPVSSAAVHVPLFWFLLLVLCSFSPFLAEVSLLCDIMKDQMDGQKLFERSHQGLHDMHVCTDKLSLIISPE